MLRSHRGGRSAKSSRPSSRHSSRQSGRKPASDGVLEPDRRLVFAMLAIGMIVGALMTSTDKSPAKPPIPGVQAPHAANQR